MQKSKPTWSAYKEIAKFQVGQWVRPHLVIVGQEPDANTWMVISERRVNQFTKEVRYLMEESEYSWPESRLRT